MPPNANSLLTFESPFLNHLFFEYIKFWNRMSVGCAARDRAVASRPHSGQCGRAANPVWNRPRSSQWGRAASGPIRSSCTTIGPLCSTVQMCKGPTRHCVGITLWYAASAAPKGFAQRTHLGPLVPRHGRMTVNPSLRVGHALVRGRAEASMRDRAATPKGFEQRTYLGPLPPRHGRVTFSPALRGGHTLERCREAPSSRGRAAAASNPLAQQPC